MLNQSQILLTLDLNPTCKQRIFISLMTAKEGKRKNILCGPMDERMKSQLACSFLPLSHDEQIVAAPDAPFLELLPKHNETSSSGQTSGIKNK